jgi:hypothetical protein
MRLGIAGLVLAAPLFAAGDLGRIAGTSADSSGAALVDAVVAAVNEDTGIRRSVRSDSSGQYAIGALEPGLYKVTARKPGFQTVAQLNVEVKAGTTARVDFTMPVGSYRETVTVESAPAEWRTADSPGQFTASRRAIDALPLDGRGILTLAELAPGVVATPASSGEAGQFSVNGQRANKNYFSVDGVSANSGVTGSAAPAQFSGGALPGMTAFGGLQSLSALGGLQEARIDTSDLAPESGRMPGAQVKLVTRSGSNDWHGSAGYGFRNERLAGNDWFAASRGYGRAPLRLNQWAGALGGPILRNRTFFFATVEGLRLQSPFAWVGAAASEESRQAASPGQRAVLDAFPRANGPSLGGGVAEYLARGSNPSRLDSGSVRIDHALTSKIALFGRFMQAPSTTQFGDDRVEESSFRSRSVTLGMNGSWNGGVTTEFRMRAASDSVSSTWRGDAAPFAGFAAVPGTVYGLSIGGLGQALAGATDGNRQGQLHLVAAGGRSAGAHAWRVGVEYQRLTPARERAAVAVAGYWTSLQAFLAGQPLRVAVTQADEASSLVETLSTYVQDSWRVNSRLTLTYGLRWEITPAPSIRQTRIAVANSGAATSSSSAGSSVGSGDAAGAGVATWVEPVYTGPLWPTRYGQVAPRVGVAYRAASRSVVRASWGVFYDLGFSVATDPINGFPFNRWQFGDTTAVSAGTAPGFASAPAALKLPRTSEWNVSWEQTLGGAQTIAVSYTGAAGRDLLRREAGLLADGTSGPSIATNHGRSDFHSLGAQYSRRLGRGVEAFASYRWGHSIDDASWDSAVALAEPGYDARRDRGNSSFDARHSFSMAVTAESRGLTRSAPLRRLTSDWKAQAIVRARSGFPIDVLESENALGLGWDNFRRPDLVPGVPLWIPEGGGAPGGRRLNPAAFASPAGMQGTLGRNAITGFGMFQADAALRRTFPVRERASLEFGVAVFNVANHPIPANPVRYRNSPLFGQPVSLLNLMLGNGSPRSGLTPAFQLGSPRSAEIAVRLRF